MKPAKIFNTISIGLLVLALAVAAIGVSRWIQQESILRKMIERLTATTRLADVLVTRSEYDETAQKIRTTIKFLEYDAQGKPLEPKYFTFSSPFFRKTDLSSGNAGGGHGPIIQFQSLVIRFQDKFVETGDRLRGKSAYLFMKAFVLDGSKTQVFDITRADEIPGGYQVSDKQNSFEMKLWKEFWHYALDPKRRERAGIQTAQIEAPGSMFLPGTIYTLRIEHDGGIRIDAQPVPEILKGENIEASGKK